MIKGTHLFSLSYKNIELDTVTMVEGTRPVYLKPDKYSLNLYNISGVSWMFQYTWTDYLTV